MPAIGIDLGTTNCCVAVFRNGRAEVIANDRGNRTTPSCVAFTEHECLIGEAALNQLIRNPMNTVYDVKRFIGRSYAECASKFDMNLWPFNITSDGNVPQINVQHRGKQEQYTAKDISAMLLRKMKQIAEAFLDEQVKDAVITVPAYFNDSQRRATKEAAQMAGLNVLRLVNEPTAAAIAYGLDKNIPNRTNIMIYDIGGGTFDVSILTFENGELKVRSTAGDTNLGGASFVERMVTHFTRKFRDEHGRDLSGNRRSRIRLLDKCEQAKCELSSSVEAFIQLDALFEGIDLDASISRAYFDHLNADLFERTLETVNRALADARMSKADLDHIVLVGGSTRIVKLQTILRGFFGGKELKHSINPDEAVACGAAVLAANLGATESCGTRGIRLVEVTPLSLGVATAYGVMSTVIPRNTVIPVRKTKTFVAGCDSLANDFIRVYEGELSNVKHNQLIGEIRMKFTRPKRYGEPLFEIEFHVNEDGILEVTATEFGTTNKQAITIMYNRRLGDAETERMIEQAERMKISDEKFREHAKAKRQLRDYVYSLKRSLENRNTACSDADCKRMLDICDDTIKWLATKEVFDKSRYVSERKRLEDIWRSIGKRQSYKECL